MMATFSLGGLTLLCNDSPVHHAFTFTPSMSLFVTCRTERDIDRVAGALSEGGEFLMPPDNYGFSRKFAWVKDKYGVSWQLKFA